MKSVRLLILSVLALVTVAIASESKQEWPKWLGPQGDNICREEGLLKSWPDGGPRQLWSVKVQPGFAAPVAVDGRVYLHHGQGGKETLTAYDLTDGKELWSQTHDGGYRGRQHAGTRATPTIEGERIYTSGGGGDIHCRRLSDGKEVWHTNVLKATGTRELKWGMSSAPVLVDGMIVVQCGLGGPAVIALDKDTGAVKWKSQARDGSYASVLSIVVEGKTQLIATAASHVFAINPADGKTLWSEPWETQYGISPTTPVFRDGHLFISSGYGHGCMMVKVTAEGHTKLWEKKIPDSKFPAMILDGDHLYVVSEKQGSIVCLNWPDGKLLWSANDPKLRLGFGGSILRYGGDRMIAYSDRGTVSMVKATSESVELLGQKSLFNDRSTWAHPIIYRGRLLIRGTNQLICLDLRDGSATRE